MVDFYAQSIQHTGGDVGGVDEETMLSEVDGVSPGSGVDLEDARTWRKVFNEVCVDSGSNARQVRVVLGEAIVLFRGQGESSSDLVNRIIHEQR